MYRNPPFARCSSKLWLLLLAVTLVSASGASCPRFIQQYNQPLPVVLQPAATLDQILGVINDNAGKVQSYSARATITSPELPATLHANVLFRRPRDFRMRGGTTVTGPELDLGSNDDQFWFWVRRNQPPALFFCRHEQFAQSAARQIIPVEPEWIVQALGVASVGPGESPQGPFRIRAGRTEIRSTPQGSGVGAAQLTIIDDTRGFILEQHVYDSAGNRLATAIASRHARDPASGVVLPRRVVIQFPPTKLELTMDLTDIRINGVAPGPTEMFARPNYPGYTDIDLANAPLAPAGASPGGPFAPAPGQIPPAALGIPPAPGGLPLNVAPAISVGSPPTAEFR